MKRSFFAFPYALLTIIFVILPLALLFVYAFRGKDGSFTFNNFSKFWQEETVYLWKCMWMSFSMAFLTTAICLIICYPLAIALSYICKNKMSLLVMLFVIPMWINSLLRIYAIKFFFSEVVKLFDLSYGFTLLGMVYDFMPFMLLPIYTSIANMDKGLIEAAGDLGAHPAKTLFKVKLPLSVPGIVSGVLMVFMPTMSTFAVSEFLGGNLRLFGNLIETRLNQGNYSIGSVYSIMMLLLILLSIMVANALTKGKNGQSSLSTSRGII